MTNVRSAFSADQLSMLAENDIDISNDVDYSPVELDSIFEKVSDIYEQDGFDKNGDPTSSASIWEAIMDKLQDEFGVGL
jgi:hypothetical protein